MNNVNAHCRIACCCMLPLGRFGQVWKCLFQSASTVETVDSCWLSRLRKVMTGNLTAWCPWKGRVFVDLLGKPVNIHQGCCHAILLVVDGRKPMRGGFSPTEAQEFVQNQQPSVNWKSAIVHRFIKGSLEVKLPTIWTDEKQRWEESEKRREQKRRREKISEEKESEERRSRRKKV